MHAWLAHRSFRRTTLPALLLRVLVLCLLALLLGAPPAWAKQGSGAWLIPMGGGFPGDYRGFLKAAIGNAVNNRVRILVLPAALASDPEGISAGERENDLQAAKERAYIVEDACERNVPVGVFCEIVILPVFVRADTLKPEVIDSFSGDISAVYILDGDASNAMQVISGSPIEPAMAALYQQGVIFGGTDAGARILASALAAGYAPDFGDETALNFGAVDLWNDPEPGGLSFGLQNAIIEPRFYSDNRPGILLNALTLPDAPQVGIGFDKFTGASIRDGAVLEQVFGPYTVTVLDAETYHAANGVRYVPCQAGDCTPLISLRNVLVHLLAPGPYSYNLNQREHSLAPPQPTIQRSFTELALPAGAGPLLLSGSLGEDLSTSAVLARFVELAGGDQNRILVVAAGYPSDASAQRAAKEIAAVLPEGTRTLILGKTAVAPLEIRTSYTGIVLTARDQSRLKPELLTHIKEAWLAGTTLLLDNGAAAVAGPVFSDHGQTPEAGAEMETALQKSFLAGNTHLQPGLGLIEATFEPQVVNDNRWGRLFSLAYNHPKLLAVGLSPQTALEITSAGPAVIGDNVVLVLDLGTAELETGENQAFVIANGLLDVFAPGEQVAPILADINAQPDRAPTPMVEISGPIPAPVETITPAASTAVPVATTETGLDTRPASVQEQNAAVEPETGDISATAVILLALFAVILVIALLAYLART